MKVMLSFGVCDDIVRRPDADIREVLFGKLVFVDFIFVKQEGVFVFHTCSGDHYKEFSFNTVQAVRLPPRKGQTQTLLLDVSDEEAHKLFQTAMTFATLKIPYNAWDICMFHSPFRNPEDKSLFHLTTMNDVQSVILFFRECLHPDSPTRLATHHLHSRTTLWDTLYTCVKPCAQSVEVKNWADFLAYTSPVVADLHHAKTAKD